MNIVPLRKTILKESLIFGIALCVLAGAVLYVTSMHEDYVQQKEKTVASARQLVNEKQAMEKKFAAVQDNIAVYEESQRQAASPGLFLDAQAVRDLFNLYQARFSLKKLSVEMQAIVDITNDPKYVRPHFVTTKANARVIMEALTDEDVYNLIVAMQKELSGFVKITSLTVTKKQELSKEILAQVKKEGTYPLISAEMTFDWYGLKSTDKESAFNRYIPAKAGSPAK